MNNPETTHGVTSSEPQAASQLVMAASQLGLDSTALGGALSSRVMIGESDQLNLKHGLSDLDQLNDAFEQLRQYSKQLGRVVTAAVAFPFDPAKPGTITIPKLVFRSAENRTATIYQNVGSKANADGIEVLAEKILRIASELDPHPAPVITKRIDRPDRGHWAEMIEEALSLIARRRLRKIVLSRSAIFEPAHGVSASEAFVRLHRYYPSASSYLFGNYAGASPELVLSIDRGRITSRPLAGTRRKGLTEQLRESEKDTREHAIVVQGITEALSQFSSDIEHPNEPSVLTFGPVQHLMTTITGTVNEGLNPLAVLAMIAPTAAVAGDPKALSVQEIIRLEDSPRDLYAGIVGTIDSSGDADLHLALRNVRFIRHQAEIRTGVGIVAGSDAHSEFAETEAKIDSVTAALS
ncbi:MAG: chorismate-binding protein [Acidimicrobiaceae bacterium]|nr:chorismate-binding protein [Acidimicrobiaceae bacterium]